MIFKKQTLTISENIIFLIVNVLC